MLKNAWIIAWAFLFAIGFSQLPNFAQQYLQALNSAAAELETQVESFRGIARREGLSLEAYLNRLSGNTDLAVGKTGGEIRKIYQRQVTLSDQRDQLLGSPQWLRPILIARNPDNAVLERTASLYQFTLLLDPIYAAGGAVLSLLLTSLFSRRRKTRA